MTWKITLTGTGPLPSITTESDVVVVVPPPPPPPPPPPVEDDTPFQWPPDPRNRYDPSERYAALGEGFYASEPQFENPLPASNAYAGRINAGRVGSWDLAGYALWAPREAEPAKIRRALATGNPARLDFARQAQPRR